MKDMGFASWRIACLVFILGGASPIFAQYYYSDVESGSGEVWSYSTLELPNDGGYESCEISGVLSDPNGSTVDSGEDVEYESLDCTLDLGGALTVSGDYQVDASNYGFSIDDFYWYYLGDSYGETYVGPMGPTPEIGGVIPTSPLTYGEGDGYLQIFGQNFDPDDCACGATVYFASTTPTVEYTSGTQINVYYGADPSPGSYDIDVATDAGGISNAWLFTIAGDSTPNITSVDPAPPWQAGSTVSFTISGSGFGTSPGVAFSCCIDSYSVSPGSSDSQISGTATVDAGAGGETTELTITSNGYGGLGFLPGPGQNSTGMAFQIQLVGVTTLTQNPLTLNMSVGDPNKTIGVTVSPAMTFTPLFSTPTLLANSNSNCTANLTVTGQQGNGTANATVTAANPGSQSVQDSCSGVFNVAAYSPAAPSSATAVTVPPQAILIQMYSETGGGQYDSGSTASNIPELSVAWAARNRFQYSGTSLFNGVSTYQGLLDLRQVAQGNVLTYGQEPELDNAVAVFTGLGGDVTGGSTCYWSPKVTQMGVVQNALQSGTTTFPVGTGEPGCWGPSVTPYGPQIVWRTSMPANVRTDDPAYTDALAAFLFERARPSASAPAVVQIP